MKHGISIEEYEKAIAEGRTLAAAEERRKQRFSADAEVERFKRLLPTLKEIVEREGFVDW